MKCFECQPLLETWKLYSELAAPNQPPIANFLWHPSFQIAVSYSNFQPWMEKGLTQFCRIGRHRVMFSKAEMEQKVGSYPSLEFHYRQVHNLVTKLQKHQDVFQPLTLFELLAINIQNQRRVLAHLYKWLLNDTTAGSKVKDRWEGMLNLNLTTLQWEWLNIFNQTSQ